MAEGKMERAVAAHGDPGDGAVGAARGGAIALFDKRKKFPKQEILVANLAILGIDVKVGAAGGRGDEKIFQLAAVTLVLDEIPQAGMNEELFVVAKAMKFVEDGEPPGFVGVERGGKYDAVRNIATEDFAGEGVAFDAAGSEGRGDVKEVEEGKEVEEKARRLAVWSCWVMLRSSQNSSAGLIALGNVEIELGFLVASGSSE